MGAYSQVRLSVFPLESVLGSVLRAYLGMYSQSGWEYFECNWECI